MAIRSGRSTSCAPTASTAASRASPSRSFRCRSRCRSTASRPRSRPTPGPSAYSGSIQINISALGLAKLGLANTFAQVSIDDITKLFRHVTVYCRRKSDGAWQYVEVLRYALHE